MSNQWWEPHPLDCYDQWKLLEIAESADPPNEKPDEFGEVELPAKDGWQVVFFYDCGELDYIDSFVTPDGLRLAVWGTDFCGDQWPPVMTWREVGDLERLRAYLSQNTEAQRAGTGPTGAQS